MKYCLNCIMPDTRPDQFLNQQGVCNACTSYNLNNKINWKLRKKEFNEIIQEVIKNHKNKWNCVIPSSGGKDSTYQAIRARELGLSPVLVTATTCDLSEIGKANISNLKSLGFDTVEISNGQTVRNNLNKIGLELIGDIAWPEHVSIFTIPIRFALNYKIPLILWGENPQIEYGGPKKTLNNSILDRAWLEEFGGLIGLRVNDFTENYNFTREQLTIYNYPSTEELNEFKIKSVFLGFYEKWDSIRNYEVSKKKGFKDYNKNLENCYFNFEKIDNYQHGIHDYFKFLKFGFGRATDQLSYCVRRRIITRKKALSIAKLREGKFPLSYMGKKTEKILSKIGISMEQFEKICDKFTNKKIFKCDKKKNLVKRNKNLTKIKYDN